MVIAQSSRILLRHIVPDDIDYFHKIYNKEENMRYVSNGKSKWSRLEILEKCGMKQSHRGTTVGGKEYLVYEMTGEVLNS
ncbi:hypothetical protein [Plebeiibacterium marinum]|uniref:Uncharacterized protein n=1 Tax=Plebeiibacterium marinum TaxID=2992111 RepID=A0AAE3ME88_9BACT|nr:hypothetical protein [Plebeiobacterium marinum]MCW3805904.1 hypothetical protein [Plebeiobacterium marinum]